MKYRLFLFPLLVAYVVLTQPLRRVALFFWSVTFQTNLMGWIGMTPGSHPFFQMAGVNYLITVALVWWLALGGKEDNTLEAVFNGLIHYWTAIFVLVDWIEYPRPDWPQVWWLLPYPLVYFLQMPIMNMWAGWRVYPFDTPDLLVLSCVFIAIVGLVHVVRKTALGEYDIRPWLRYPELLIPVVYVVWLVCQPLHLIPGLLINSMMYCCVPILAYIVIAYGYQLFRSESGR